VSDPRTRRSCPAHGALVPLAQDVYELFESSGDEGVALLGGWYHKLAIESGAIDFIEVTVGLGHGGDAAAASSLTSRSW